MSPAKKGRIKFFNITLVATDAGSSGEKDTQIFPAAAAAICAQNEEEKEPRLCRGKSQCKEVGIQITG